MSGNGVDLAAVHQAILAVSAKADTLSIEMRALRTRVDDLDGKVEGLREAVNTYHGSVVGHGIMISELGDKMTRVEQHLGLPPAA